MKKYFCRAVFVSGLLVCSGVAQAFQLSPIARVMTPKGKEAIAEFRLINDAQDPIAAEVKIMKRTMSADGQDTLTDVTDEFSLFPAQTIISPSDIKMVRVQWLGNPDLTEESAYRIIAEQVPVNLEQKSKGRSAQIQIMLKYIGSLYVRPEGLKSHLQVVTAKVGSNKAGKTLQLTVANKGKRHTLVKDVVLKVGEIELKAEDLKGFAESNILAGVERTYQIPYPAKLGGANLNLNTIKLTYRESD